jgi:(E)-4-hydroxy-3-methylbut-2-enyl-diphosphate synthase
MSGELGLLFLEKVFNGIWLINEKNKTQEQSLSASFGLLQASRVRISKTEFISCPSCGRTLFDLQKTTASVKKATGHLKGLKIAIMGCIVNGPGEMADADYGYVGATKGKITLYKNKRVVRKNIPSEDAVNELVGLIKENGDWKNP